MSYKQFFKKYQLLFVKKTHYLHNIISIYLPFGFKVPSFPSKIHGLRRLGYLQTKMSPPSQNPIIFFGSI